MSADITIAFPATAAERDVLTERRRQIDQEGWTASHDDKMHESGDLARAGACYARNAVFGMHSVAPPVMWPWSSHWWKPTTPRRDLVKAAALLLAEIERIDRAEAQKGNN